MDKERLWLTGTLWGAVIIACLMIISSILFAVAFVYILIIGGAALVVVLIILGVHTWQVKRLPIKQDRREALRLTHQLAIEKEQLRLAQERHEHELQMERERHEQELLHNQKRLQLETHLALTRVLPDAKGHYPYIARPEGGYYPLPNVNMRITTSQVSDQAHMLEGGAATDVAKLPSMVRYDDIRKDIPRGHTLLGIGEQGLLETRPFSILSTCWIVGGSKTGKTNTVALKVAEAYMQGSQFLVIDPHSFKSDSLYNSIKGYEAAFIMPMAQETEQILPVLHAFLAEFERRKAGGSYLRPLTLLVDEIGSLTTDGAEDDDEKQMITLLKKIARVCGQEARGFDMYGMFISQDAAGLAWLRKRAMTVIAHKVLMMSERQLVCNENTKIAREMDTWPIGRVLVYGLAFDEIMVLQQPVFNPQKVVDADMPQESTEKIRLFSEHKRTEAPGVQLPDLEPLHKPTEQDTDATPTKSDDKQFTIEQETEFVRRYRVCGSIRECLALMHLSQGRYQRCASRIVTERKLRRA
jgi:hypothetical protein